MFPLHTRIISVVSRGDWSTFNLLLVLEFLSSTHSEIRWDLSLANANSNCFSVFQKSPGTLLLPLHTNRNYSGGLCVWWLFADWNIITFPIWLQFGITDPHLKRSEQYYYRLNLQQISDALLFIFSCRQGVILQLNPDVCLPFNAGQKAVMWSAVIVAISASADDWACVALKAVY